MFSPFFRSYLPGFRVEPDDVPGFNIDDNGLPRRAYASFDDTLPDAAAQQYSDGAQTQRPPSISFSLPGAEGWILSVPWIASPEYPVAPQNDVPGFNVKPQDDVPGFKFDESGLQQQETNWSEELPRESVTPQGPNTEQIPTLPPAADDQAPPARPLPPEWPHQVGPTLPPWLPPALDPLVGSRIEINSLPSIGSAPVPRRTLWSPYVAPQQPPGIDIRSRAATAQNSNLPPTIREATRNTRLPPLTASPPNGQVNDGKLQHPWSVGIARQAPAVPLTPSVKSVADTSRILADAGDAGVQQTQQQVLPPQSIQTRQQTPASPPDTGRVDAPPALRVQEKPGTVLTPAEHLPEQELSQLIEECRRAAADLTQELARAATHFGRRVYEDTIQRMGREIPLLAERFAREPWETAESIWAAFPQTRGLRAGGEFLASLAVVFNILANAVRGREFLA